MAFIGSGIAGLLSNRSVKPEQIVGSHPRTVLSKAVWAAYRRTAALGRKLDE